MILKQHVLLRKWGFIMFYKHKVLCINMLADYISVVLAFETYFLAYEIHSLSENARRIVGDNK